MTSGSKRDFMALNWLATHYGRPGIPTGQAWIESLFGHPHIETITDISDLRAGLDAPVIAMCVGPPRACNPRQAHQVLSPTPADGTIFGLAKGR